MAQPFKRLIQGFRTNAPELKERFEGLLSGADPISNLGIGLLAASGPSQMPVSLGQAFGQAAQFATSRQQAAMQNQAMREAMVQRQRQQQAQEQLAGLLSGASGQPQMMPTSTGGQDPRQQMIGLLAQADPGGFAQAMTSGLLGQMFEPPPQQESPFAKINPSDFTPESVAEFQRSLDFSALRRLEEAPEVEMTDFEKKLKVLHDTLARDLTETEILDLAGVSVEKPENILSEVIPPTQISSVRLADGSTPDIGTTWGQAKEAGAKVYSAADLKRQEQIEGAMHTLGRLQDMALGPNGVFVDNGGSPLTNNVLARLANGISNGLGAMAGTQASVRRSVFDSTAQGVLSSLVRSMGESGALSEGDTTRAINLIPTLGAVPVTEREARLQFSELRTLLTRGIEGLEQGGGGSIEFDFDPATGRLIARQ